MGRGWFASVAVCIAGCVAVVGCTSPGTPGVVTTTTTTTTVAVPNAPVVSLFMVNPTSAPAPALVSFLWTVSDPNGDELTCRLDADGDGNFDITIADCEGTTSRNHAFDDPISASAVLEVSDGTLVTFADRPVSITAGVAETFDIVVRPILPFDPSVQAAFDAAEARWESILVRGITNRLLNLPANYCVNGAAPVGITDDLVIDASVEPIDGTGGVLGQAGPCVITSGDNLPRVGVMQFDSADVANMEANGTLDEVILHEMGHVLGIGTIWDWGRTFLQGGGTSDPRYSGSRGVAEWDLLGGAGNVPVEANGGPGTADSHWRESTFDSELMTGYIEPTINRLSAMSIASLADLGYQVDLAQADPYSLPVGPMARAEANEPQTSPGVMLRPTPTGL